jgi:hypothetical protein
LGSSSLDITSEIESLIRQRAPIGAQIVCWLDPIELGPAQTLHAYAPVGSTSSRLARYLQGELIQFCLGRRQIRRAKARIGHNGRTEEDVYSLLTNRARRLLRIERRATNRSGECGELILYLLLEAYFRAPQLVAKMKMKTSPDMFVHGTDGIHFKYDAENQRLILILGESKTHAQLMSGIRSALESVAKLLVPRQFEHELDLICENAEDEIDQLSAEVREAILEFLDPFSGSSAQRLETVAVLLVHDLPIDSSQGEEQAKKAYLKYIRDVVAPDLCEAIGSGGLISTNMDIILFPVQSVRDLRERFAAIFQ